MQGTEAIVQGAGRVYLVGMNAQRLILLALTLTVAALSGCRRHPFEEREVDFEQRVPTSRSGKTDDLHFALAAMISPKETHHHYVKLVKQLARKVGQPIKLFHGRSYKQVNMLLRSGKIDMALICTGGYTELLGETEPVSVLAVPRVRGKTTYRSYVIVREADPARTFADLVGRRFAFTDPLSNTGYLYPMSLIRALGSTKERFFASYTFVGSHDRAIRAVQRGVQDAAAVDHLIFEYLKQRKPGSIKGLRILGKSPEYGIPPVVASRRSTRAQRQQWRRALLSLHEDATTKGTLRQLEIERFVLSPPNLYHSAIELWKQLR